MSEQTQIRLCGQTWPRFEHTTDFQALIFFDVYTQPGQDPEFTIEQIDVHLDSDLDFYVDTLHYANLTDAQKHEIDTACLEWIACQSEQAREYAAEMRSEK